MCCLCAAPEGLGPGGDGGSAPPLFRLRAHELDSAVLTIGDEQKEVVKAGMPHLGLYEEFHAAIATPVIHYHMGSMEITPKDQEYSTSPQDFEKYSMSGCRIKIVRTPRAR